MKNIFLTFIALSMAITTYSQNNDWNQIGNTTYSNHFLGTTNNSDLVFKTNSIERMRLSKGLFGTPSLTSILLGNTSGQTGNISGLGYPVFGVIGGNQGVLTNFSSEAQNTTIGLHSKKNGFSKFSFIHYAGATTPIETGRFEWRSDGLVSDFYISTKSVVDAFKLDRDGGISLQNGPQWGAWRNSIETSNLGTWRMNQPITVDIDGTDQTHNIGIGMNNNGWYFISQEVGGSFLRYPFQVSVDGMLTTRGITVVKPNGQGWPDYVFEDDYKLESLSEVEKFINTNKHLPNVPSEKEVTQNGINLAEMDAILLQKIEELTLYMIELKKENEALKKTVNKLIK